MKRDEFDEITGVWEYEMLPRNIRVGRNCWFERKESFGRFQSQRDPGLVIGNRVRVYTWATFNIEPAGFAVRRLCGGGWCQADDDQSHAKYTQDMSGDPKARQMKERMLRRVILSRAAVAAAATGATDDRSCKAVASIHGVDHLVA